MLTIRESLCCIGATLLLAASGCQRDQPGARAGGSGPKAASAAEDRPGFGGDFSLTGHDGRPFDLRNARGKVVLLFFGYTFCPDICPTTMSRIVSALDLVPKMRSEVLTLFVSVDPRRDTPAALKEYVANFKVPLIGLTGRPEEIAEVAAKYHATYSAVKADSPNYLVNHTTAIFLIDRRGQLRNYFAFDENPGRLAAAVQAALSDN
jgi:protein SCO1/2